MIGSIAEAPNSRDAHHRGADHNREAPLAVLDVLEGLLTVDARMARAIRDLAG